MALTDNPKHCSSCELDPDVIAVISQMSQPKTVGTLDLKTPTVTGDLGYSP